jgi:hypothetical protein
LYQNFGRSDSPSIYRVIEVECADMLSSMHINNLIPIDHMMLMGAFRLLSGNRKSVHPIGDERLVRGATPVR